MQFWLFLLFRSLEPFTISRIKHSTFFANLLTHMLVHAHAHAHTKILTTVRIRQIIQRSEQFSFVLHSREIDVFASRMAWHLKKRDWIVLGFCCLHKLIYYFVGRTYFFLLKYFGYFYCCRFFLVLCSIDNKSISNIYPDATQKFFFLPNSFCITFEIFEREI